MREDATPSGRIREARREGVDTLAECARARSARVDLSERREELVEDLARLELGDADRDEDLEGVLGRELERVESPGEVRELGAATVHLSCSGVTLVRARSVPR